MGLPCWELQCRAPQSGPELLSLRHPHHPRSNAPKGDRPHNRAGSGSPGEDGQPLWSCPRWQLQHNDLFLPSAAWRCHRRYSRLHPGARREHSFHTTNLLFFPLRCFLLSGFNIINKGDDIISLAKAPTNAQTVFNTGTRRDFFTV